MNNKTMNYYQSEAKNYFNSTYNVKLNDLWTVALELIPINAYILDLGCGSGRDTLFFSSKGYRIIGLDYSFNLSSYALHLSSQPIVQADFRNTPFRSESYDIVWSVGSLLHIMKSEIHSSLLEIKRILKQDGLLITSIKEGAGEETLKDGRFFAYYGENEWKKILIDSGYLVKRQFVSKEERRINNSTEIVTIPWIVTISQKKKENYSCKLQIL
jgi:SAM-dependent methyltransferase